MTSSYDNYWELLKWFDLLLQSEKKKKIIDSNPLSTSNEPGREHQYNYPYLP